MTKTSVVYLKLGGSNPLVWPLCVLGTVLCELGTVLGVLGTVLCVLDTVLGVAHLGQLTTLDHRQWLGCYTWHWEQF